MDYKTIYLNAFNKKMKEIDLDVISQVKVYKERNKKFTAVANQIEKDLREKEDKIRTSLQSNFPDLYERYSNRFKEYDSDHLTSCFKYDFTDFKEVYSDQTLKECAGDLGKLESYTIAAVNFSNSDRFLEAIYILDKNYDHYTLDFEPNKNPVDSNLFREMQKERFQRDGQEPSWEDAALKEMNSDSAENLVSKFTEVLQDLTPQKKVSSPSETQETQDNIENEIRAINPQVKLFLIRQLYYLPSPIKNYFSVPEFMKLIKILELSYDTTIFENKPSDTSAYRPINKGLEYYKQIKTREKIKSDAIKYLNQYGLTAFKEYVTFHSK